MNAMSALYHIAQNDPPTLKEPAKWSIFLLRLRKSFYVALPHTAFILTLLSFWFILRSVDLVSFITKCLNKDPKDRPSTEDLMQVIYKF